MSRLKILAWVVVAALLLIIVLQNTRPVQTRILFITITMPNALLIAICVMGGAILGLLSAAMLGGRRGGKP